MEKKEKLKSFLTSAGNAAKHLYNSAVQSIDQNDDGKFDLEDVSAIAGSIGEVVKSGTQSVKDSAAEAHRQHDLKTLQPIFSDTLNDAEFTLSKLIRIAPRDKKHADSIVCQNSIGYNSDFKGFHVINIFSDSVPAFGLSFYPDMDSDFYYADPIDRNRYISLDEYFSYLKVARINELQKLAQDLGAKHFKVTFKEEQTSFSAKKTDSHGKAAPGSADVKQNAADKKYSLVEIAAEMSCAGHAPSVPSLVYLQRDPSIQALVAMRLDEEAPLLHQKFMLKMSSSSGMKETDAVKIDAVLKSFKCSGNATVTSEVQNESRRYLEYEIDF